MAHSFEFSPGVSLLASLPASFPRPLIHQLLPHLCSGLIFRLHSGVFFIDMTAARAVRMQALLRNGSEFLFQKKIQLGYTKL